MKIIKKIFGLLIALLAILFLLIGVCHFIPGLSEKLGNITSELANEKDSGVESSKGQQQQSLKNNKPEQSGLSSNITKTTYIAPDIDSLKVEPEFLSLTGYIPVSDTGETITKEEVEEIERTIPVGETGENLSFDEEFYPYYAMLDENTKTLYRQIYANMEALIKNFRPVCEASSGELKNAFMAVCNDQPQLFYINTAYAYKQGKDGKIAEIELSYAIPTQDVANQKEVFESKASQTIENAARENSNYDKEVIVHDMLMNQITYRLNAPMNQSAYSAIVNGETVCAGYARAFQYICMQLGIPCYYCAGYAGENHAWNIIKLDDEYYNVDVTWDDTDPNRHDYFNCSDSKFAKDHARRELSVYLPACNGDKYSDLIIEPVKESIPEEAESKQTDVNRTNYELPVEKETQEESIIEETTITENETESETEEIIDISQVVSNIEDYYKICAEILKNQNKDSFDFKVNVKDKELCQEILNAYQTEDYKNGYVQQILKEKGKDYFEISIESKRQSGGMYVLNHKGRIE